VYNLFLRLLENDLNGRKPHIITTYEKDREQRTPPGRDKALLPANSNDQRGR